RDQADVIMNIVGNVISVQVTGETAKQLSERFGKIMQERESISINRNDTSVSKSKQLEPAIPPSRIASLSSGEFVGMVADNPDLKIKLKVFHNEIQNDHERLSEQSKRYREIPPVRQIDANEVQENYLQVKLDVVTLVGRQMERLRELKKKNSKAEEENFFTTGGG